MGTMTTDDIAISLEDVRNLRAMHAQQAKRLKSLPNLSADERKAVLGEIFDTFDTVPMLLDTIAHLLQSAQPRPAETPDDARIARLHRDGMILGEECAILRRDPSGLCRGGCWLPSDEEPG